MKILHAIYDDLDNPWVGGGGAVRTLEIYSRIAALGHTVVVVCGGYPGAPRWRVRSGVRYRHVGRARSHVGSRLAFMVGAARLIMRGGYDIVIEDVSPYSPLFASLVSRDAPAVASVQNLSGRHARAKHGRIGVGPELVEAPLLRSFRNFVAVSPGVRDELRRIAPEGNRRVIPNSAAPVFFGGSGPIGSPRPAQSYILSLGRIDVYQKGMDRLLAAYAIVAAAAPDVRLVIAGAGATNDEERLRAAVRASAHLSRIEVVGEVSPLEAAMLMRGALVLAMPSRYEAWPITAIEAGAAGIPVVGSDIVGVRDAAPAYPRAHGVLVAEGDIEALAREILGLARNLDRARTIGARGRQWAEHFTWDALAERQLNFYEELVEKGR